MRGIVAWALLTLVMGAAVGAGPAPAVSPTPESAQVSPCALLAASEPATVLGGPVGPPTDLGAQCMAWLEADATKFVGLALPPPTPSAAGLDLDGFWEHQKDGLAVLGVARADLKTADGPGELAVYADYDGGMQLWVLWGGGRSAIVTVGGVSSAAGLAWARALAQAAIDAG